MLQIYFENSVPFHIPIERPFTSLSYREMYVELRKFDNQPGFEFAEKVNDIQCRGLFFCAYLEKQG